jgi:hypothetical protein
MKIFALIVVALGCGCSNLDRREPDPVGQAIAAMIVTEIVKSRNPPTALEAAANAYLAEPAPRYK